MVTEKTPNLAKVIDNIEFVLPRVCVQRLISSAGIKNSSSARQVVEGERVHLPGRTLRCSTKCTQTFNER